jgi:hypothetical protein
MGVRSDSGDNSNNTLKHLHILDVELSALHD